MIIFKRLSFQNFLSAGNQPVEIDLNASKTTLIHGTNGSGKSTILDALTYSLFNKPFRKVNLPQLINTQNKKGLVTEIEFSIGGADFRVVRGMKPKVFEIYRNGEQIENKAADKDMQTFLEQSILKLTYKSFTQIVILGSSNFIPFMQLPSAGRRECVEDFLDIKVFSTMSVIAKERLRGLKESANVVKGDIGNLEYKIDLQEQRIRELESHASTNIKELEDKIAEHQDLAAKQQKDIITLTEEEEDLIKVAQGYLAGNPEKKVKEFNKVIIKMGNKVERLNKEIAFYQDNDVCHACKQDLTEETKTKYITKAEEEVEEFNKAVEDARGLMAKQEEALNKAKELQVEVQDIQQQVFKKQTLVTSYQKTITECENKLTELQMNSGSIDKENGKLELLQEDLQGLRNKHYDLVGRIDEHEVVVGLLKDSGIKTQIVKKYLPVMNKYIRKYLTELDLPLHFVLDEQFNESVSSPLHQDFSYASFSEGQKGRIDLALLFTWREVCRLKNSVSTNILFLDEVFSGSLDEAGKELLLHLLRYNIEDTNVVVVDHTLSGTFKDKFDRTIEVNRVGGFSRYN
ncbi:recombination-related endonuclease [Synechococcus phage S-B68]|nr:recombination-related endonuclease [Synechococcus phage S-B68]